FIRRLQDSTLALDHRRLQASSPRGRDGAGGTGTTRHACASPLVWAPSGRSTSAAAWRERVPLPPTPSNPHRLHTCNAHAQHETDAEAGSMRGYVGLDA